MFPSSAAARETDGTYCRALCRVEQLEGERASSRAQDAGCSVMAGRAELRGRTADQLLHRAIEILLALEADGQRCRLDLRALGDQPETVLGANQQQPLMNGRPVRGAKRSTSLR